MASILTSLKPFTRKLRWRLTLSYTAVTVCALLVLIMIGGLLIFQQIFVPNQFLLPQGLIQAANTTVIPGLSEVMEISPQLIPLWLGRLNNTISDYELLRMGDTALVTRSTANLDVFVVDAQGVLVGMTRPGYYPEDLLGAPLIPGFFPGLEEPLKAALSGVRDPERLYSVQVPDDAFLIAVPIFDQAGSGEQLLGVFIGRFNSLPTRNDIAAHTRQLLFRSLVFILLGAGLMGAIFGALTAKNLANRFQQLSLLADSWSRGDFSQSIEDRTGDELSDLGDRLNSMADQLQRLLKKRQQMAVSDERNRLARDLHDSAKQQALAASFQLGTALTLIDSDAALAKEHLQQADQLVDAVREELIDLIHELRPPASGEMPFADILKEFAIDWAHRNGIEVELSVQGENGLPLTTRQALLRIMQEALANVARHAAAGYVQIAFSQEGNAVRLLIDDDGVGFDSHREHRGLGLQSMRERAQGLRGDLIVESTPGEGASIAVHIPLE